MSSLAVRVCYSCLLPSTRLSTCARCGVVTYCCRAHQKRDWPEHKLVCGMFRTLNEGLVEEERKLRDAPRDSICEGLVFQEGVGHFWDLLETRTYMTLKYVVVHQLSQVPAPHVITRALAEAMDCLRLSRTDELTMRQCIPSLLLQLDKLQECCDFIKWCVTRDENGEYVWSNPVKPLFSVMNADMTEPITVFFENADDCSPHLLGALTFIKMKLANMLEDAVKQRTNGGMLHPRSDTLARFLAPSGGGNVQLRSLAELTQLFKIVARQSIEAFQLTHKRNAYFWPGMLDPESIEPQPCSGTEGCPHCVRGARMEISGWVPSTASIWSGPEPREFINSMLAFM